MERNASLDHLRILLTALVVFHHTAIVYGGSGGWYWREQADASNLLLVIFNCINQSFFMGFFFLLAGYFSAASLTRKSSKSFLQERATRLGIPLLVYYFLLSPLTIALASYADGHPLLASISHAVDNQRFGPGPMWFTAALLAMSIGYLMVRPLARNGSPTIQSLPPYYCLLPIMVGIGLISFAIRLWLPVGKEVLWMQLGYFAPYLFLFAVGVLTYSSRLLERIRFKHCKAWLVTSLISFLIFVWILITRLKLGGFHGGWNINALLYALWDPVFSTGIILGLLWSFQRWFGRYSPLSRMLARRAYAVFIIHAPVVVWVSGLAAGWAALPLIKFVCVGSISILVSVAIASALLKLPRVNTVI